MQNRSQSLTCMRTRGRGPSRVRAIDIPWGAINIGLTGPRGREGGGPVIRGAYSGDCGGGGATYAVSDNDGVRSGCLLSEQISE